MDPERLQKIERWYHAALEREESQRAVFLREVCADESLRCEVESLLAYGQKAEGFIELPAIELAAREMARDEVRPSTGRLPFKIGHYRTLRLLGEGGMGIVYEAEQEQPRRTVALKVIKPGLVGLELLRRFEQESQALGRLQHPGIAQVYEAGATDSGFGPQPYFAMELIRGESLLEYARAHQLNTRRRLELIAKVCEAVHHAHQRGIIHRDLKPGNILVDESGQPKVLDFGVARVTDSDAQATRQTDVGRLVGTLAYMSPEQVLADTLEVDARSDVYALGVILYELLAGRLPYNVNRKLHEAVQTIQEEEPAPLNSVSRAYRGDIETIVAKALEKDKARRYSSSADLAADIRRYLSDEPITARPASTIYQLRKFARRHRALVTGVSAVFVVLVAGVVAGTSEAMRANRSGQAALAERDKATDAERRVREQRDRALRAEKAANSERDRSIAAERKATNERDRALRAEAQAVQERNRSVAEKQRADTESATAQAVNNFLQNDLLAQASASTQSRPDTKPDPDLKVRIALDRAAKSIAGKFDHQPSVEASIRHTIGRTYRDLGLYSEAQQQLERVLELRRSRLGEEHPDTLASMADLAELYDRQGKAVPAEALYLTALERRCRILGEEHPDTLSTISNLASMYQRRGKHAQAETLYTKVLEAQRRILGEEHPATLSSIDGLATLYLNEAKYAQAEPLFTKVLEVRRRTLGEEHPDFLNTVNNLAELYRMQGKYAQAEPLYTKVLEIQHRVLGGEHPDTLNSMNNLAGLYVGQGKYARAESLHTSVLEAQRRVLGDEHRNTLLSMNNLALVYYHEGKYAQAEALYARALDVQSRVLGDEHRDTLVCMLNLAATYRIQHKYAQAEPISKKVVELQTRILGEEHPNTLSSLNNLAVLYRSEGKYGQAEPLFTRLLEVRRRVLGEEHPNTLISMNNLARLYQDQGKYAQAEPLYTKALEIQRRALGGEHPNTLISMANLARLYRDQGKYTQAEPLYTKVLETQRRVLGGEHPDTLITMNDQATLVRDQGRCAEADGLFIKLLAVFRRIRGPEHRDTTNVLASLGQVRLQQQKYAEAESLLREALTSYEKTAPDDWGRYSIQSLLGASLAGQEEYAEAERLLVSGYEGMIQREAMISAPDRTNLRDAGDRMVQLYRDWGKPEKAAEWRARSQSSKRQPQSEPLAPEPITGAEVRMQ